ncbi:hypothetical protein [Aromatoleum aromaticum]|uniref:hypothetical protein n=1 Tax=Aromatoleum aromaticum TaxID=551760 RepID=UPI00031B783D|nr:hypothetical protein [Aromatoleum aromaticum]NMG54916.1 hypothetical protein [Aromatoleum aromaticum]
MDTPDEARRCGTCARFGRRADDRLAAVSAFGNCTLMPAWQYRSPHAQCHFDPLKWEHHRDKTPLCPMAAPD